MTNVTLPTAIETLATADLVPYARNSRTHNDAQVAQIAASIREFGFTNPILIDEDNGIIAGHGRVMAARKLDLDAVPCLRLTHLTEAQRRAYVIADNRLALNAGWDDDMLRVEFAELQDLGFDLDLTGFDPKEIDAMLAAPAQGGLTDEDAVPDAPAEPKTQPGDLWQLGRHRLLCDDATSIDAVDRLMGGQLADLIVTDPPYGMSYGGGRAAGSSPKGARVKAHGMIKNDDAQGDDLVQLVRDAAQCAVAASKPGAAAYVCFTWRTYAEFESALNGAGLKVANCIVWDKRSIGLGNAHYRPQHEFMFYCKGDDWRGGKAESDIWSLSRGATSEYVHPTQKPVELLERALNNSSKAGDVVIDSFGGSGSTLIACEKTGRSARLMDLDQKYCDVIIKRWEDFTGETAELVDE